MSGMGTSSELWTRVDGLCDGWLAPPPRSVAVAAERCTALGLPAISVTPALGRLLEMLARLTRARNVLEIGTLGGYSTAWLAEGVEAGGRVVTIEIDPERATAAEETFRLGGLAERVCVRRGAGLEVLAALEAERTEPFDLVFIDADKANSAAYFDRSLTMTRPGGLIVVDNVVRDGAIADASSTDPSTCGSREVIVRMGATRGVVTTVLQTVGSKGYDGVAIAFVNDPARR